MTTYWVLLAIAGFLSLVSLWKLNFWLSACGGLAWFLVWWYNLGNPPTNIAVNTWGYQILYFLYILLAIGTFFNWVRNRNRIPTNYYRTAEEQAEYDKSLKELSKEEMDSRVAYRDRVQRALRTGRYNRQRRR